MILPGPSFARRWWSLTTHSELRSRKRLLQPALRCQDWANDRAIIVAKSFAHPISCIDSSSDIVYISGAIAASERERPVTTVDQSFLNAIRVVVGEAVAPLGEKIDVLTERVER